MRAKLHMFGRRDIMCRNTHSRFTSLSYHGTLSHRHGRTVRPHTSSNKSKSRASKSETCMCAKATPTATDNASNLCWYICSRTTYLPFRSLFDSARAKCVERFALVGSVGRQFGADDSIQRFTSGQFLQSTERRGGHSKRCVALASLRRSASRIIHCRRHVRSSMFSQADSHWTAGQHDFPPRES